MWPFRRGPLLDAFAWLVASFADRRDFASSRLVLPAPGFFTHDGEAGHAMATYAGREGMVRYVPALLREPLVLIGTLADELGYHLLALPTAEPPPIDGDDEAEYLADLAAVHLGFSVFLANQAFSFAQHGGTLSQDRQMRRRGYLPEPDLAFATALFVALRGLDPEPAARRFKPHLATQMRQALRDLDRHGSRIAAIRVSAD